MRGAVDVIAKTLARLVLSIFFRRIEIQRADLVPRDGAVVYAVNHPSAIVDPMLVFGFLPRCPRFLARHGLWDLWAMRPLLALAGSIPVYRPRDAGADPAKNVATFARCHEELARGGAIALFPEGVSHSEPSLMPLRTGVARIVLEAGTKPGDPPVRIVPIGLTFDAKQRFRSRVLVRVGPPIDPSPEKTRHGEDPEGAVRALTERVNEALREVTLNYGSWQRGRLLERAAEIYARPSAELPQPSELSARFDLQKAFVEGYEAMVSRAPDRVVALEHDVELYDRVLRFSGLRDEHVISTYPKARVVWYTARTLALLLVGAPLAVVGTILNWLPYKVAGWVAKPFENVPEQPASKKVIAAIFAFPVVWGVEGALAAARWGTEGAFWVFVLAPISGYTALRFHEERARLSEEGRIYLRLRMQRALWRDLQERRRRISEQVSTLADEYRASMG